MSGREDRRPPVVSTADPAAARAALCRCVTEGGVALFPADTVYGLACDPLRREAALRTAAIKGRPPGKPSALLYFDAPTMRELLFGLDASVAAAVTALLPGPITAVVPNPERRYPLAAGDRPLTLGLRLIEGPLAGAGCVVLQTSANRAGEIEARRVADVDPRVAASVDLVVDGGELPGTASTVVDLTGVAAGRGPEVIREGAVPAAEIRRRLAGSARRSAGARRA